MIKADHKKWARFVITRYLDKILHKEFSHFYLVNEVPLEGADQPLLITPNHISWWDGFFIDLINRLFYKKKFFIMMLEEQLKRYPFFKKVGAYSIQHGNKRDINESLNYTAGLLSDPRNVVIIYPQGKLEPSGKRPITIKKGLLKICTLCGNSFTILPAASVISYYDRRKPDVYCRFSSPFSSCSFIKEFENYQNTFIKNIDLAEQAACNHQYREDLFKWKK